MAVYRQRRRSYRWLLAALTALVGAAAVLVWMLLARGGEDEDLGLSAAIERITAHLDVLVVSHYTENSVTGGQVQQPGEYEAALRDLETVRSEWTEVRDTVAASPAAAIDAALAELDSTVERRGPPAAVAQQVEELIRSLDTLRIGRNQ